MTTTRVAGGRLSAAGIWVASSALAWWAAASALEGIGGVPPEDPSAAIALVATAGVAVLSAWLSAGWTVALLGALPGRCGLLARPVARSVTPAVMRRAAVALLSAGSWLPVTAAGATPATSALLVAAAPLHGPASPTVAHAASNDDELPDPGLRPDRPTPTPAPRAPTGPEPARPPAPPPGRSVTVVSGDTLWGLAARSLGPAATPQRVAVEWPRWFAANRQVLDSPDLIRPGQILLAPDSRTDQP